MANGTIDAICSDHQPHDLDAKLGAFPETEAGVAALETLLPLTLNLTEKNNAISLSRAISFITHKPAQILGLKAGALTVGYPADVCVFNPHLQWEVNATNWQSAGVNTPFWGKNLTGRVIHTLQTGKVIYTLDK